MLPIKAKSDVFEAFKNFKAYAENQSGHRIKILRDDKGIQITLGDDSQCTVLLCIYLITDLGDDSQCTRGKAVQLQIKYLSR